MPCTKIQLAEQVHELTVKLCEAEAKLAHDEAPDAEATERIRGRKDQARKQAGE